MSTDELIEMLFKQNREAELIKKYDLKDKTFLVELQDKAKELASKEVDPERQKIYLDIDKNLDTVITKVDTGPVIDPIIEPVVEPIVDPEPVVDPIKPE